MEASGHKDGKIVNVTLCDYHLDMKKVPVQGIDREIIENFCRKDPLQLLEYWSVDFDYDGKVHTPQFRFTKENHNIEKMCSQLIEGAHRISIRAVDVFGNSTQKVVEI